MRVERKPDWKKRIRFARSPQTGHPIRVAYEWHVQRQWIGGRGYVPTIVVRVWDPRRGETWEEAAALADAGEQFGLVLTPEEFEKGTRMARELTGEDREAVCLPRENARKALTAHAGTERIVVFVSHTDGRVRVMRYRYDPQRRAPFDATARSLLPVFDLDKQAARFVNLDAVLR